MALGYVVGETTDRHPFAKAGRTLKGHEFHYSDLPSLPNYRPAVQLEEGEGLGGGYSGYVRERTIGSYVHWHFGSASFLAENFVEHCKRRSPSLV